MPELMSIALSLIDEPPMPARVAMDDTKLRELMGSMTSVGLLQPIGLRVIGERYEIEFGHRRYVAAKGLAWSHINALVFTASEMADGAAMLAENIYREDLSAAEEAILFAEAAEKYTLDEAALCARFRVTPDYLGDRMRLLRDDPAVFRALLHRQINFSVARELNKLQDEPGRLYLLDVAVSTGYSARVIADQVRQWRVAHPPSTVETPAPTPATEPLPVDPYKLCCALCGGDRDPFNLINVNVHRWEWERLLEILRKQAEVTA